MSVNKYKPHLAVLPEDDPNRQLANGFSLNLNVNFRAIEVLTPARGWKKVINKFREEKISEMREFPEMMIVLLIDFDREEGRLDHVKNQIPEDLKNRVFVLGVLSEPEKLKSDIGKSFEKIGEGLAKDCSEDTNDLWGHKLLSHNKFELDRMILSIKPFLFN